MADSHLSATSVEYLADCLLNHRSIALPEKGYWGRRSLAALAAVALAVLRNDRGHLPQDDGLADALGNSAAEPTVLDRQTDIAADARLVSKMIDEQWHQECLAPTTLEQNVAELNRYFEPAPGLRRIM